MPVSESLARSEISPPETLKASDKMLSGEQKIEGGRRSFIGLSRWVKWQRPVLARSACDPHS